MSKLPKFLVALILVYVPIFYFGTRSVLLSDEYFYYMMGRAIADGFVPYGDFFTAHMPLMLYPLAVIYKLFGFGVFTSKILPILSSFCFMFLLFLVGEKIKRNVGLTSCLMLFLFSPDFHRLSHSYYGVFLSLAPLLLSYYFLLGNRDFLSGLFSGISLLVRLNNIPVVLVFLLFYRRKRFALGLIAVLPVFLLLAAVPNFVDYTILYHMKKGPMSVDERVGNVKSFFSDQWLISLLSVVGAWRVYRRDKVLLYVVALSVIFTLSQKSFFDFYFMTALPFLAILSSFAVDYIKGRWLPALVVLCVLGIATSAGMIQKSYAGGYPFGEEIVNKVERLGDGKLLYLGSEALYAATLTDSDIGNNFIDISQGVFYVYSDRIDDWLIKSLDDDVGLAVTDLTYMAHMNGLGIGMREFVTHLKENYYPADVMLRRDEGFIVFWKPIVAGMVVDIPRDERERRYLGNYVYGSGGMMFFENETYNGTELLPGNLRGENRINLTIIAENVPRLPLVPYDHYIVNDDGISSEVWVTPVNDSVLVSVLSHSGGRLVSYLRTQFFANGSMIVDAAAETFINNERLILAYGQLEVD